MTMTAPQLGLYATGKTDKKCQSRAGRGFVARRSTLQTRLNAGQHDKTIPHSAWYVIYATCAGVVKAAAVAAEITTTKRFDKTNIFQSLGEAFSDLPKNYMDACL